MSLIIVNSEYILYIAYSLSYNLTPPISRVLIGQHSMQKDDVKSWISSSQIDNLIDFICDFN